VIARRTDTFRDRGEKGQMLVLGAGFFAILLVLLGVALYFGSHMTQRRNLQNVADAAAMAGAQELNGTAASESAAIAKAQEYINLNVDDLDEAPAITVGDQYTSITVSVKRTPNGTLPIFGLGDQRIGARAKAQVASPFLPGPGVVPMSISNEAYTNCVENGLCDDIVLKEYAQNNSTPQSSYQLLDLGLTPEGDGGATAVCNFLVGQSHRGSDVIPTR
jgi:hypothetical protein